MSHELLLADVEARGRIASELDCSLVCEAAAGTGKTTALVGRMVAAIAAGKAKIGEMVAVTFTDAAAGELKLRLRGALEDRRISAHDEVAHERLTRALGRLEEARIGTIHAFCTDLLRERPVEARVDPVFEVAAEDVARGLLNRVVDRWFEAQLADPAPAFRRIVRRTARRRNEDENGPREALRRAAWELCEQRDFPTPWAKVVYDRDREIDEILVEMRAIGDCATAGDPTDYLVRSLERLRGMCSDIDRRETVCARDYDGVEVRLIDSVRGAYARRHWAWKGYARRDSAAFPRSEILARRDALKGRIDAFVNDADAALAPDLRVQLWPLVGEYEAAKNKAGVLDFLDLLTKTRDLVRDHAGARAELQRRFRLIYVDEFQDTDPLQAEILLLLACDDPSISDWRAARVGAGKLFIVGDPKQSIYRFRRADVSVYEAAKLVVRASGGDVVELTASFRALPELQRFVNAAFAPIMTAQTPTQARYVPLSPVRQATSDQPAIIALPVPKPYGDYGKLTQEAVERSAPDAVAAFVEWLCRHSGWTVDERGDRVPIEPHHVCFLFRRMRSAFSDVTAPYLRALEARGLPHVLIGASPLRERDEVLAVQNALHAIERPDDALRVYATLRGPFFALADASLLAFKDRFGTLHAYRGGHREESTRAALPESLREVADALAVLRELHRHRNRRTFADTLGRLLHATRAHAGLAVWPTGEQALANVARLLELGRRAERRGLTSFRMFAEALGADDGGASDAPVFEADAKGVRLMSVHKAKGLEFPVVVLADVSCREVSENPSRTFDASSGICAMRLCNATPRELTVQVPQEVARDREESARILYVAATRARELLIVPVVGDEPQPGWTSALHPALYPAAGAARSPVSREVPPLAPFGDECVVDRPPEARRPATSVSPGVHLPTFSGGAQGDAGYRVTFWDPAQLSLGRAAMAGVRQQTLLQIDDGAVRADEGVRAHAAWREARAAVRAQGERPSEVVTTATAAARDDQWPRSGGVELEAEAAAALVETLPVDPRRPAGAAFGTLVHALLAAVDLADPTPTLAALAEVQRRLLGATPMERDAALGAVSNALRHPLLLRAAAAAKTGRCRREVPVSVVLESGTLLEGVVDAAFLDDDGGRPEWTVIDFKTDRELAAHEPIYRRQVALYARAIAKATGQPARPVLLRV